MARPAVGERQAAGAACYVYGIVPADVEVEPGATGLGDPPAPLRVVREGELAALVSEVDPSRPLGAPEDLIAHARLLDAAAAQTPVLPIRFGAVLASEEAVAGELLAAHHDEFAAALAELEGRAEYLVRGRYAERPLLEEILAGNQRAARLREEIRGRDEALTRPARVELGEIIAAAVEDRRAADTVAAREALSGCASASVERPPGHENDAVNLALLVAHTSQDELRAAVEGLAGKWQGRVELRLLGPLAPYDFVSSAPAEA